MVTLEAAWTNATLFYERASGDLASKQAPVPLTLELPEVRQAAESLGIDV